MRRYIPFLALILVALSAVTVSADTIYLKNGSVIKGKVVNFADDQFVVQLNIGSDRSRAQIFVGDVTKIDFDSGGSAADAGPEQPPTTTTSTPATQVSSAQPGSDASRPPATDSGATGQPSGNPASGNPSAGNPSSGNPPGSTGPQPSGTDQGSSSSQSQPASGQPAGSQPAADSGQQPTTGSTPSSSDQPPAGTSDSGTVAPKSPNAKTAAVDVLAKRDWTSTGLIVRRGDHITITATGTVTLDPGTGETSGPEGIDAPDAKKLMPDRPTGALIAVIGADNDDFIFIGRSADFTASRDGLLFLSVNEGNLSDNVGSYKATLQVEPGTR